VFLTYTKLLLLLLLLLLVFIPPLFSFNHIIKFKIQYLHPFNRLIILFFFKDLNTLDVKLIFFMYINFVLYLTSPSTFLNFCHISSSNNNGVTVVNFATSKNLIVKSIMFPHRKIHKYAWTSPDGKTHNHINHVLVDRRRQSGILDVRSFRGADCDTDH
jgi:hypothetical protein